MIFFIENTDVIIEINHKLTNNGYVDFLKPSKILSELFKPQLDIKYSVIKYDVLSSYCHHGNTMTIIETDDELVIDVVNSFLSEFY